MASIKDETTQTTATQNPQQQTHFDHWKDGYPAFAKWMNSSDDFLVLRRFGQLNIRVLLLLQDRIVRKEEELLQIDEFGRQSAEEMADCSSLRHEPLPRREQLLDELKSMLKEYNEYLVTFSQSKSWPTAQDYQIQNVENWLFRRPHVIDAKEQEFLRTGRDLVALVRRNKSPSQLLLQKYQPLLMSGLFKPSVKQDQVLSSTTTYFSHTGFDLFMTHITIFIGLLLLFGPMWWLQFVADNVKRLGIITGFVTVFTALLTGVTVAKPFEVLAAAAAYSAVLMVFLQADRGSRA